MRHPRKSIGKFRVPLIDSMGPSIAGFVRVEGFLVLLEFLQGNIRRSSWLGSGLDVVHLFQHYVELLRLFLLRCLHLLHPRLKALNAVDSALNIGHDALHRFQVLH